MNQEQPYNIPNEYGYVTQVPSHAHIISSLETDDSPTPILKRIIKKLTMFILLTLLQGMCKVYGFVSKTMLKISTALEKVVKS